MKRENRFILEVCRFRNSDVRLLEEMMNSPLDYPYILGQLLYNRMGGVAYYVLQRHGLLPRLNREFRNSLRLIYEGNTEQTESFLAARELLAGVLKDAAFPYAALKGSYLAGRYPKGLRTSNDFDLLVSQENVGALSALLKSAGFQQGYLRGSLFMPASRTEILSSRMNRGETVPFVLRADLPRMEFCEVDVNFSLDFKARQEADTVGLLLENAEKTIQTAGEAMYTLSPEDFLIHLCVHLYKEATVLNWVEMGRDLSLYKFCDLYLLLTEDMQASLADSLARRIARYGLEKECYYALFYTRELFRIENGDLDRLLAAIQPADLRFLRQVLRPADGALFQHDMTFEDWLFCSSRKEQLYEVEADGASGTGNAHYLLRFGRVR